MRLPFCKFIINKWYDTKMRDEGAIIAGSCCDIDWGKFYKDDKEIKKRQLETHYYHHDKSDILLKRQILTVPVLQ